MNTRSLLQFFSALVILACTSAVLAQTSITIGNQRQVTTSITLGQTSIVESILPLSPPLPVNLPPGNPFEISLPFSPSDIVSVTFYKDGSALPSSTGKALRITSATIADSGHYRAHATLLDGQSWNSDDVVVRVENPHAQRLINLSARATVSAANPVVIAGFVVPGSPGKLSEFKKILLRVVGPSLATFEVPNPLALPQLRLYRADGTETALPSSRAAASASALVGAFPLLTGSADIAVLIDLPAGAYSAHASSANGGNGDLLLEIYDVPDEAVWFPVSVSPPPETLVTG